MTARIHALSRNHEHASSKQRESRPRLLQGLGVEGGEIREGDAIRLRLPPPPHRALQPV